MLQHLYIRNYALIRELNIDFHSGFSVITGETGAGKSILLGAINLLSGQRADLKAFKDQNEKCVVEASFNVSSYKLRDFFEANGLDYDDECVMRREISAAGKSRAFINDSLVQISLMKDLGLKLLDIHSQHQNLLLNKASFLLNIVDTVAGNGEMLAKYKRAYAEYVKADSNYQEFVQKSDRAKEEEDYLRGRLSQLEEAKLVEGELEELEEEQALLSNAEEIKEGLFGISDMLESDTAGVVAALKRQMNAAQALAKIYPPAEDFALRIGNAYVDLKDLSQEVDGHLDDVNFDPQRIEFVNGRISEIYSLQQRFRLDSVAELMALEQKLRSELDAIEKHDETVEELARVMSECRSKASELASRLSEQRRKTFPHIEQELQSVLANLGMPDVRIRIDRSEKEQLSAEGIDTLAFLFSANKNRPLQDIADIASGGEMARVMLAIKHMMCKVKVLPTVFFDEIDTGVSGEMAARMGDIMSEMGKTMQVISITHLPQIAAKGERQYKVFKDASKDGATTSNIRLLSDEERVEEIATMLSGDSVSEAAINNAKDLLRKNGKQ